MKILIESLVGIKRKLNSKDKYLFIAQLTALFVLSVSLNYFADKLLPWNYVVNLLRATMAIIGAVITFTLTYSLFFVFGIKIENSFLMKYSFKQRLNLCLLGYSISAIIFMIGFYPETSTYTTSASFLLTIWLVLALYIRPTIEELQLREAGMEDIRDIINLKEKKEKYLEKEERKRQEKDKKEKAKEEKDNKKTL